MPVKIIGQILAIVITFTIVCTGASAQTTVYKWIDEDGVVHFGDAPPDGSNPDDTETVVTDKPPPPPDRAQPAPTTATAATAESNPALSAGMSPAFHVATDITKMSLVDLDLRCDEAREKAMAPLREAEIADCKQNKREDPAFCEQFYADFGDGGRTASGAFRPRMFDDLPECVDAVQELNRRGR